MGDWFLLMWLSVGILIAVALAVAQVVYAAKARRHWYEVFTSNANLWTLALFGWAVTVAEVGPWWAMIVGPCLAAATVIGLATIAVFTEDAVAYVKARVR
jgi:hypothetical protein